MFRFRLTELAEHDLDQVIGHIADDNPKAANAFYHQLLEAARLAAEMPFASASRDDLRPGVRMKVVGDYIMFFLVDRTAQTVDIIRILHGRRDLKPLVANAPKS